MRPKSHLHSYLYAPYRPFEHGLAVVHSPSAPLRTTHKVPNPGSCGQPPSGRRLIARIDAWIAYQPGYDSRQDAIRHCVDLTLGQPTHEREFDRPPGTSAQDSVGSQAVD